MPSAAQFLPFVGTCCSPAGGSALTPVPQAGRGAGLPRGLRRGPASHTCPSGPGQCLVPGDSGAGVPTPLGSPRGQSPTRRAPWTPLNMDRRASPQPNSPRNGHSAYGHESGLLPKSEFLAEMNSELYVLVKKCTAVTTVLDFWWFGFFVFGVYSSCLPIQFFK